MMEDIYTSSLSPRIDGSVDTLGVDTESISIDDTPHTVLPNEVMQYLHNRTTTLEASNWLC